MIVVHVSLHDAAPDVGLFLKPESCAAARSLLLRALDRLRPGVPCEVVCAWHDADLPAGNVCTVNGKHDDDLSEDLEDALFGEPWAVPA